MLSFFSPAQATRIAVLWVIVAARWSSRFIGIHWHLFFILFSCRVFVVVGKFWPCQWVAVVVAVVVTLRAIADYLGERFKVLSKDCVFGEVHKEMFCSLGWVCCWVDLKDVANYWGFWSPDESFEGTLLVPWIPYQPNRALNSYLPDFPWLSFDQSYQ